MDLVGTDRVRTMAEVVRRRRRLGFRALRWPLLLVTLLLPATAFGAKRPIIKLPVDIAVASCPTKKGKLRPVKSNRWVRAHVAAANRVLKRHKIVLNARIRRFTPAKCALLTRADRNAMAIHVRKKNQVTVLVVKRIRDLDNRSYNLRGLYWPYRGKDRKLKGRRWVMLTKRALRPFLAHELAHFFGLHHDPAGGNLMTPGPSSPMWKRKPRPKPFKPVLNKAQGRQLRRAVLKFLAKAKKTKKRSKNARAKRGRAN